LLPQLLPAHRAAARNGTVPLPARGADRTPEAAAAAPVRLGHRRRPDRACRRAADATRTAGRPVRAPAWRGARLVLRVLAPRHSTHGPMAGVGVGPGAARRSARRPAVDAAAPRCRAA